MKNPLEIESELLETFYEKVDYLDDLFSEKIKDLHDVKGGSQSRHNYIFYRKLLWEAKAIIRDNAKP
jgi:predicted metal-dependent hydrolase